MSVAARVCVKDTCCSATRRTPIALVMMSSQEFGSRIHQEKPICFLIYITPLTYAWNETVSPVRLDRKRDSVELGKQPVYLKRACYQIGMLLIYISDVHVHSTTNCCCNSSLAANELLSPFPPHR